MSPSHPKVDQVAFRVLLADPPSPANWLRGFWMPPKVDSLTRLIISTLLNAFRLLTLLLFNENIVCLFRLFFFQNQRAYEMYFRI